MSGCIYCGDAAEKRLEDEDDSAVCGGCWSLLQSPDTALPLMRGHLTAALRGRMPAERVRALVDGFVEGVARRMAGR